jgi:hypothetical protein
VCECVCVCECVSNKYVCTYVIDGWIEWILVCAARSGARQLETLRRNYSL